LKFTEEEYARCRQASRERELDELIDVLRDQRDAVVAALEFQKERVEWLKRCYQRSDKVLQLVSDTVREHEDPAIASMIKRVDDFLAVRMEWDYRWG
jgi:hypothetical protein